MVSQYDTQKKLSLNSSYLDDYFSRLSKFGFSGVVLVAKGDEIVLNKGYGFRDYSNKLPMTKETILSIGSISKQYTATMILQLKDQGKIELDNTLEQYFDNVPDDKKGITIYQLLTHTSGLEAVVSDFEMTPTSEYLQLTWNTPLQFEPGSKYRYSNTGYSILGIIIEIITDKDYQTYFRDELLPSLGITRTSWFGDPRWNEENITRYYLDGNDTGSIESWKGSWKEPYWGILANGGVCTSTEQLFIWMRSVFSGNLLSPDSLNTLITPNLEQYACGWSVDESPLGLLIEHNGGNHLGVNAIARYYKDHDLTFLILSNVIVNGFGYALLVEDKMEALLQQNVVLPPIAPETVKSSHLPNEIENFSISTNNLQQIFLHPITQDGINQILGIKDLGQYEYMNKVTKSFGEAILQKEWGQAFSYTENKSDIQRRAQIIESLLEEAEEELGKIERVDVTGTIPFPPYLAASHLQLIGKDASNGIPIVWNSPKEILGFRPLLSKHVLTIPLVQVDEYTLVGYHIETEKSIFFDLRTNSVQ